MPGFNIGGSGLGPSATTEIHRDHRWMVLDFGFPNSIIGTRTRSRSNDFRMYAKSVELPSVNFEEAELEGGSIKYKVAKNVSFDPITLTMYDAVGLHALFDDWQKVIWSPESGIQTADKYFGEPKFALLDGLGRLMRTYKLINAYPKTVSHSELSYQSTELKLLKVVFSYSWVEINLSIDHA